jgi:hypothetical protein
MTDGHKRPCRAYDNERYYYLLTETTIPDQGQFYKFRKRHIGQLIRRLPKRMPFEIEDISPNISAIERNHVRNRALGMRADYAIQLLKILGHVRYHGKAGRKLLYITRLIVRSKFPSFFLQAKPPTMHRLANPIDQFDCRMHRFCGCRLT